MSGTSGTYEPNPPATDVVTAAYQTLGVINEDETPTAGMYATGISGLNALIKELYATGIHVWTEQEAILFLQANQVRYLLGGTTTDHCADAFSYTQNALNSSAAAGATALLLQGGGGFQKDDQFAVVLDTGAAFWTTLAADPVGNAVTLAAALPSSASAQNFVYGYADNIVRPLRVPAARRLAFAAPGNFPIETTLTNMMSRQEYMDLPNKFSPGQVTQAFYNPARDQGEMYVWPAPSNATAALRFTWYRPIQTFASVADLADLPVEWENALKWNLAKELGPSYSVSAERWDRIVATAKEKFDLVAGWDREFQSIKFGLSMDQTARS